MNEQILVIYLLGAASNGKRRVDLRQREAIDAEAGGCGQVGIEITMVEEDHDEEVFK